MNSTSIELTTSKTNEILELYIEIEQDLQISVDSTSIELTTSETNKILELYMEIEQDLQILV
ncbi:9396_t:CDS:1, partial [Racocetra persica]